MPKEKVEQVNPDDLLHLIRDASGDFGTSFTSEEAIQCATEALNAFTALDHHIRMGGPLPKDWQ
jgi:hypothetical protein